MKMYVKPDLMVSPIAVLDQILQSSGGTLSVSEDSQNGIVGQSREFDEKLNSNFWGM
ncbi:MAG: hypothetical protein SPF56_04475 [Bacteroidaceae bacterium]|nr:hypothetical protein [Prevotellaceae bacterium]MDY5631740.1 hypothetical protein [Bacteroidaceae bacterium]